MKQSAKKARRWSTGEIAYVKANFETLSHAEMAEKLGRSTTAIKAFCTAWGYTNRHSPLSAGQLEVIRELHGKRSARQVASLIGCTVSAIHKAARRMGIAKKRIIYGPEFDAYVRAKHALGWSDQEIRDDCGCDRHTVGIVRARLGLASNQSHQHQRERTRQMTAKQCAAQGVPTLAHLRAKVLSEMAVKNGWPDGLPMRSVQILNALWEKGPMTRQQICEAIGVKWRGSRRTQFLNNQAKTTYLADLMARGLVVSHGRIQQVGGPGKNVCIYSLNLWVERGPHEKRGDKPAESNPAVDSDDARCGNEVHQARRHRGDGDQAGRKGQGRRREGDEVCDGADSRRRITEGRDVRSEQLRRGNTATAEAGHPDHRDHGNRQAGVCARKGPGSERFASEQAAA